jgi:NADPH:quinone reductase-like Zn-dependent oxidoreductase
VGCYAVQIARIDGARVTAVTGAPTLDLVRSLGAERVVDRAVEDVLCGDERFDVVIDAGGYASSGQLARVLTPAGRAVSVGAGDASSVGLALGMAAAMLRTRLRGTPVRTFLARLTRDRMETLAALAADGRLVPVIGSTVQLEGVPAGLESLMRGLARGKTTVELAAG